MALPSTLWTMNVVGQYLSPGGRPWRGFVTLTPEPVAVTATQSGTPVTITLQTERLDLDGEGFVVNHEGIQPVPMLNPNDPTITPGIPTGNTWGYTVVETFERGPVIAWRLLVPQDIGDGDTVDLAMMVREDQDIIRPADYFPRHLIDTAVQASRISPRSTPLMRRI